MDVWVVLDKWPTSDNDWGVNAVCESKERAEHEVCEGHELQAGGENWELYNHPRIEEESEYENGGDWLMLKKREVKTDGTRGSAVVEKQRGDGSWTQVACLDDEQSAHALRNRIEENASNG